MRAVTFQAPGEVRVDEKPDPEIGSPDEAIIRSRRAGCAVGPAHLPRTGRDRAGLHDRPRIRRHGRRGGGRRHGVAVGDRVLGTYGTAWGTASSATAATSTNATRRVFGHGELLGSLQGSQADMLLVPRANMTLRRVPEGMSDEVALFAGDVMGTGYHASSRPGCRRETRSPCWARPGRALRGAGGEGGRRRAGDRGRHRCRPARAGPHVRRHTRPPDRGRPPRRRQVADRKAWRGRGGRRGRRPEGARHGLQDDPEGRDRLAIGVYAEPIELHMGVVWLKALTLKTGHANVIKHLDRSREAQVRRLDPAPSSPTRFRSMTHPRLTSLTTAARRSRSSSALRIDCLGTGTSPGTTLSNVGRVTGVEEFPRPASPPGSSRSTSVPRSERSAPPPRSPTTSEPSSRGASSSPSSGSRRSGSGRSLGGLVLGAEDADKGVALLRRTKRSCSATGSARLSRARGRRAAPRPDGRRLTAPARAADLEVLG